MSKWFLYVVKCTDESLYTGITTDLQKRISKHNAKNGAKSLRGKLPVKLVYSEEFTDRGQASKREYAIKQLPRAEKLKLIQGL